MEKKARFGTGEGHTVLDKDNFAVPERNVLPHSEKGVQLPFQTTPDSPRVIPAFYHHFSLSKDLTQSFQHLMGFIQCVIGL